MEEFLSENGVLIGLVVLLAVVAYGLPLYVKHVRSRSWLTHGEKLKYEAHWIMIMREKDLRHAVMDADKLVDELLMKKGYQGSFGDKLKSESAKAIFTDYNGLWTAHKLRNRLAHELGMKLQADEARLALTQFGRALKDLGIKT